MKGKKRLYKIYSRNRLNLFKTKNVGGRYRKKDNKKIYLIVIILIITIFIIVMNQIITPIFETICLDEVQGIAMKIESEGSSRAMENFTYNDIYTIEKDSNR